MGFYSIDENAVTDIKRRLLWLSKSYAMQPLAGMVDGTNHIFSLMDVPVDSASLHLYEGSGTEVTAFTLVDDETGSISFATAPTVQVYATYKKQAITDTRLAELAVDAFMEMESRYPRGWCLYNDLYVSSSASELVDPDVGSGQTFSTSLIQRQFFLLCFEYTMAVQQEREATLNAVSIREDRLSGAAVDTTKSPDAHRKSVDALDKRINLILGQILTGGSNFGGFVPGAQSDEYAEGWDWWSNSQQARLE